MDKIASIVSHFPDVGAAVSANSFGSGHINDTYKLESDRGTFLLQRINHHIFKDVEGMNRNIVMAMEHLNKSQKESGENRFEEIRLYPTKENSYHHVDEEGNYWRMMNYVKDSHSVDVVETAEQAYEAAKAYAYFQRHLANLPTEGFIETIPDFHSLSWRLQQYDEALQKDAAGRAQSCQAELEFVEQHRHFADKLEALLESGDIPIRITHNDTKINNVLFNNTTRKGIAVVDLDTIMPGSVLYDFGDMMRTFLSPAAEDEPDLTKVIFRKEIFEALHKGYMEELGDILTDGEKEHLRFGGKIMTFIIGLRFLTDHLNGDVYFKVAREGHNLDRCRVQFRLLELIG